MTSSRKPNASKKAKRSSSSSEESSEDESDDEESEKFDEEEDEELENNLHSRHPWFKKWLKDGKNCADLLPEQYPTGYDPKRNESKSECFKIPARRG